MTDIFEFIGDLMKGLLWLCFIGACIGIIGAVAGAVMGVLL